jgi:hypothetical protein
MSDHVIKDSLSPGREAFLESLKSLADLRFSKHIYCLKCCYHIGKMSDIGQYFHSQVLSFINGWAEIRMQVPETPCWDLANVLKVMVHENRIVSSQNE